jgi:transcription initiation factor TFIIA large subunit
VVTRVVEPNTYRSVIDEVVAAIKSEFAEYGVGEDVLADLQAVRHSVEHGPHTPSHCQGRQKWEQKVLQSGVADFEPPQPAALPVPHPFHLHQLAQHTAAYPYAAASAVAGPAGLAVKSEPMDTRYTLMPGMPSYAIPNLPGPQIPSRPQSALQYPPVGAGRGAPMPRYAVPAPGQLPPQPGPAKAPAPRIPQVDGPSSSSSEEEPAQYAPRTSHPSLPPPAAAPVVDSEAINSDLDDSDEEGGDDEDGPVAKDLIFCTYDKVRYHSSVFESYLIVAVEGIARPQQVEVHVQGRHDPHQRQGLPLR